MTPDAVALDRDVALARSQQVVGRPIGRHRLVGVDGEPVDLAAFRGEPLVLSFVYTSCPDTCSVITRRLRQVLTVARGALGEHTFTTVTVGFDARFDTPQRMASYARAQDAGDARWHFLAGDAGAVRALADAAGFSFAPSPRGFDHVAQITVIDAEQRVYRQIYGDAFPAPALVEPLKELVFGQRRAEGGLSGWVDGLRLLCTIYDPASGRYRFDYSVVVAALTGGICLGGLALFLLHAWREHHGTGRRA